MLKVISIGAALVLSGSLMLPLPADSAPQAFEQGMNALLEGNFAEAYCQWKPLAQRGHAESQYNLGWLYANGNGLNVDMDEAHRWWFAAAEQEHTDAQFALGLAYVTGEGFEKSLGKATQWFLRAARHNHPDAREIIARLNADPDIDLLALEPALIHESWFGSVGIITGQRINVRAKPSTDSAIVAQLDKDTEVRVLGKQRDWYQIVLDAGQGAQVVWVYHSLLKPGLGQDS